MKVRIPTNLAYGIGFVIGKAEKVALSATRQVKAGYEQSKQARIVKAEKRETVDA